VSCRGRKSIRPHRWGQTQETEETRGRSPRGIPRDRGILRNELKVNKAILFLTTQSREGSKYFAVADAKEDGKEKFRVGDELLICMRRPSTSTLGDSGCERAVCRRARVSITASAPCATRRERSSD